MVNILVIDDLRIMYFNPDIFGETDVRYARNVKSGIDDLSCYEWDNVFLDHDMGDEDIMPVVDFMVKNRDSIKVGRIYSHSSNPVARMRVARKLSPYFSVNPLNLHDKDVQDQVLIESIDLE